jgi:hypothetical protein
VDHSDPSERRQNLELRIDKIMKNEKIITCPYRLSPQQLTEPPTINEHECDCKTILEVQNQSNAISINNIIVKTIIAVTNSRRNPQQN